MRIGIPVPTTRNVSYNQRCWPEYAKAVRQAGGEPVQLPLQAETPAFMQLVRSCSGFVLTGSPADITPALYGEDPLAASTPPDPARETADRLVLEYAETSGAPVLAICFGLQFLNVWRGGSLIQDLPPVPVNHAAGPQVAVAHAVIVEQQSLFAGLLTSAEAPAVDGSRRLLVNSSHHQAIGRPGDGLALVARSSQDGVVEAVEGRIGLSAMLGVQWHPERSVTTSAASRALFQWVVAEAADHADGAH